MWLLFKAMGCFVDVICYDLNVITEGPRGIPTLLPFNRLVIEFRGENRVDSISKTLGPTRAFIRVSHTIFDDELPTGTS